MNIEKLEFNKTKIKAGWLNKESGKVLLVKFDNPQLHNALDRDMQQEAKELFDWMTFNKPRVIIFTGEGDFAFSAGGDLNFLLELTKMPEEQAENIMYDFYSSFVKLARFNAVTIALINGHAVGAGFCFALACDLIYAKQDAKVGLNFVKLGIAPGMGGEFFVKEKLPAVVANDMILSGDIVLAQELEKYHLFNKCGELSQVTESCIAKAKHICNNSNKAIRYSLVQLRDRNLNLEQTLRAQAIGQADSFRNGEVAPAIQAVKDKQPYIFKY